MKYGTYSLNSKITCCVFYIRFIFFLQSISILLVGRAKYLSAIFKSHGKNQSTASKKLYFLVFFKLGIHKCCLFILTSFSLISLFIVAVKTCLFPFCFFPHCVYFFFISKVSIVVVPWLLFSPSILGWKKKWWKKNFLVWNVHRKCTALLGVVHLIHKFGESTSNSKKRN